jgi:hypothetical protein
MGVLPEVPKIPHVPEKSLLAPQQAKRAVRAKIGFLGGHFS